MAAITLDLSPTFSLGPVELAWHGVMIAVGIAVGSALVVRLAPSYGLDPARATDGIVAIAIAGIVGSRLFFLAQDDAAALLDPGSWLGTRGFAFYGAMLAAPLAAWVVLRRTGAVLRYLDLYALTFPLGMAVGRVGDLLSGEHYGPRTDAPWGFVYPHPDSETPLRDVAYQSGAFYEIIAAGLLFIVAWRLRRTFGPPGALLCAVVGGYAASRFAIFFVIRDSPVVGLGLRQAQWTSLALVAVGFAGIWALRRRARRFAASSGRSSPQISDAT